MDLRTNVLHIGDNLDLLRRRIPDESVDLVYLDPPFNSKRSYHLIFRDESGRRSDAQQLAFEDTWHWGPTPEATYRQLIAPAPGASVPDALSSLMGALIESLGRNQMTAYLVEMAIRLVELHRALRPTGSLYLHCDPTSSHYLKLVLDAIFGPTHFVNEITWRRTSAHSSARRYGPNYDTLLFYAKGSSWTWNQAHTAYDESYVAENYRHTDPDGRRWRRSDLTAPEPRPGTRADYEWRGLRPPRGRHWAVAFEKLEEWDRQGRIVYSAKGHPQYKRYLDEMPGVPLQAFWDDIPLINNRSREYLGWGTQKPLALLERIISASSNTGDVVLDPFCGCGTALEAAQRLDRRWIGIDITPLAHEVIDGRFQRVYQRPVPLGEIAPRDLAGARALAVQKPYGRQHFEQWAVNTIGARVTGRSGDRGVDGRMSFLGRGGRVHSVIVSVKSGHVRPEHVRDLKGTLAREGAAVAVFVTLEEPSEEMRIEAAAAGFFRASGDSHEYRRIQLLPVRELLAGGRPELPQFNQAELFAQPFADEPARPTVQDLVDELERRIEATRAERRTKRQRDEEDVRRKIIEDLQRLPEAREPEPERKARSPGRQSRPSTTTEELGYPLRVLRPERME